ncbi:MAG: hypothetical protein ACOX8A_11460 [Thermacetogeniaceae bacterium]|jgi:hypothetical protein
MVLFENTEVYGIAAAIRGMRNPLESHHKSDSYYENGTYILGKNDMDLAMKLVLAGSEHRKFLRQIFVTVDITAPRYWFAEFDTYKVGATANSTSTMHTLAKKPITIDMFEIDSNKTEDAYWNIVINHLEDLRQKYNSTKNYKWFRLLKQSLPEGFKQKRTVSLNYEVLRSMFHQRKNHKLIEWREDFANWVKSLPYSEFITTAEIVNKTN